MNTRAHVPHPSGAPRAKPTGRLMLAVIILVAVASSIMMIPVLRMLEQPAAIDALTVDNPSAYDLSIDVGGGDGKGWMTVGTARRRATTTFQEIIDQGGIWTFRFAAQGVDGGAIEVSRAELERNGWRLRIPESVSEGLRSQGAPPPP